MKFISIFIVLGVSAFGATTGYTTYIGDGLNYQVARIVTDVARNTYITGNRVISTMSTPFFLQEISDVFITKLDPSGNLVFTATIGGKGADRAGGLALDSAGNIYLAGSTSSPNFPLRNPLQSQPSLGQSGFLAKLSPDGSRLIYSSYFGGTLGATTVNAIAVDTAGNMYVTGQTYASDFPHTPGLPAGKPGLNTVPQYGDAFITKISADGSKILYSGILSGNSVSCGAGSSCFLSTRTTAGVDIAVDAAGNAYIAGNTNTTDLPTTAGAFRTQGIGAFVAKVNAVGTGLTYLTYLGAGNYVLTPFGVPANTANGLTLDAAGDVLLTGRTTDPHFPATPGAFQRSFSGPANPDLYPPPPSDAFVAKLSPDGSAITWATFIGGSGADSGQSIALDSTGNVWVAGTTESPEFPNQNGWSGGRDFVVELNASGSALPYSSRFPDKAAGQAVAADAAGSIHFAGFSGIISALAPTQPLSARIFGIANAAAGMVSGRIAPGELISIYGPHIGPPTPATFTVDASGFVSKSLAGVQLLFDAIPATVLYVSDSQINAIVPFGLAGESSAHVKVSLNGVASPDFPVVIISTAPEIFQSPEGAAAVNQDGSVNSASNPAKAGSAVSIYATGTGALQVADGQVASTARDYHCCQVQVDGQPADVFYAGSAPGIVAGVTQINFRLPASVLPFVDGVTVSITAGGRASSPAKVYVTP